MPAEPTANQSINPIGEYSFGVKIQGKNVGWFTECSGLSINRDTTPHAEGGVNDYKHQLPGRVTYDKVTLKRGVADDTLLWDWFQEGLYDVKVSRRNVTITLYGVDYKPVRHWNLIEAYPVKWSAPTLKSDSNQVAVESLELVHHGLTIS